MIVEHEPTISLLNKHATIVFDRRSTATATFHDRFDAFVKALDNQCYPENYLETNKKPTKEYWLFYAAVSTEVTNSD